MNVRMILKCQVPVYFVNALVLLVSTPDSFQAVVNNLKNYLALEI